MRCVQDRRPKHHDFHSFLHGGGVRPKISRLTKIPLSFLTNSPSEGKWKTLTRGGPTLFTTIKLDSPR